MKTPPIVSSQEWDAAREELLAEEKKLTRARDALAARRRRMPWMAERSARPVARQVAARCRSAWDEHSDATAAPAKEVTEQN